jgi:hypothetical protein
MESIGVIDGGVQLSGQTLAVKAIGIAALLSCKGYPSIE